MLGICARLCTKDYMQLRQDLDREDGRRNGFRLPRWQGSSHGRHRLVWILAAWARRRTRSPFPQLPALTSAATGAAQSLLEARNSLRGRKAVLLKEQLLSPGLCVSGYSRRAVHGSVRRNASAPRAGAERYLAIPELTYGRRIWFAQPRRTPYLARQRCRGISASTSTYGDGAPCRFGGGGGCTKSRSRRHTHNDFTQLLAAWMRKTLLLHVWLIRVLALERKKLQ